jgi:hypothetical protein
MEFHAPTQRKPAHAQALEAREGVTPNLQQLPSRKPPQFKLEASAEQEAPIQQKSANPEKEGQNRGGDDAAMLAQVAADYPGKDWEGIYHLLRPESLGHQLPDVCDDIFHSGEWNIDPNARSLGILDEFEYGVAGEKETQIGYVEVVEDKNEAGIRAMVPYGQAKGAHGGNVILNPHRTTTVLGRFIDIAAHDGDTQAAVDAESGTNFFRFQENFKVGENKAGGNVLSIADWTWENNNAWLQAAVERGDVVRFVSNPMDFTHLLRDGKSVQGGLTITGQELGVLINLGFAPHPETNLVCLMSEIPSSMIPDLWLLIADEVALSGALGQIGDKSQSGRFGQNAAKPSHEPEVRKNRETGEIIAKQTNFFESRSKQDKLAR